MTNEPDSNMYQRLHQLVSTTCSYPQNSPERTQHLQHLFQELQRSGKLWRGSGVPKDDYQDILQNTWIFFCCNLCEAIPTKEAYNPQRASLPTWINAYIKMRVIDYHLAKQQQREQRVYPKSLEDGTFLDPVDLIPAHQEPPPILQEVRDWINRETPALCRVHVRDRPDINCQVLILHRLPPETTSWKHLAQEFAISESTLQGFYRRECLPRLQAAGKQLGYGRIQGLGEYLCMRDGLEKA
jgi:DNA-directed RNA polymerase specialized sigma24 family protein